jgi:hypothetical protein
MTLCGLFSGNGIATDRSEIIDAAVVKQHYQQLSQRYGYSVTPPEVNMNNIAMYLIAQYGALDNVISLLEMNTQNYPASATAFSQLDNAYLKKGNRLKAVACYNEGIIGEITVIPVCFGTKYSIISAFWYYCDKPSNQ